jgi:hypothetical protein
LKNLMLAQTPLASLPGWDQLDTETQATVQQETEALGEALVNLGFSRLAVGEHLSKIQDMLQPKRMFRKFLQTYYPVPRSTVYKNISEWKNASARLPEPVLRVAMARNINMLGESEEKPLGRYTEVVKRNPPPKTEDPKRISQWIDEIEVIRKRREANEIPREEKASVEEVAKIVYRFMNVKFAKLPRGKARRTCLNMIVGMMLSESGVSSAQSFEPEAVPEHFRAVVGRPRLLQEENAA